VALVIDNVRQFESAQQRVTENQKLAEQARAALRDNERLNKRLTGRAWTEFLKTQRRDLGIAVDLQEDLQENDDEWTKTLAQAAEANHLIQDRQTIALPLKIRGQVIGAMEFELDDAQSFSPEDLELVQEISERFGLAAENTRLVEESQRVAQREALINEISTRLQGTNTVEATLTEAARSLRETLQAQRVRIRLGTVARK
jgi:GAF domain-containing protein